MDNPNRTAYMSCPECDKKKLAHYQQLIEKAKKQAYEVAKAKGLTKMVIIRSKNGQPGYREPGDESIARLGTIEIMLIT